MFRLACGLRGKWCGCVWLWIWVRSHNGFIWNRWCPTTPTRRGASTPQRVHLEPLRILIRHWSSGGQSRFNPTTGSSGTLHRRATLAELVEASTPQRVHLELLRAHGTFARSAELQPHNGFIWNTKRGSPLTRGYQLQPHNGFIWNTKRGSPLTRGYQLQPHNGFIWNRRGGCCSGRCPSFNPTTGSSGTTHWDVTNNDGDLASTPQRVHLEPEPFEQEYNTAAASTPQRVHLEQRQQPRKTTAIRCFNPTTGSSGTVALARLGGPRRRFNPTTGSSGTITSIAVPPSSRRLQPHNGFIWNPGSALTSKLLQRLQPHNGFIWNRWRGRGHHAARASTPQRVHLEQRLRARPRQ